MNPYRISEKPEREIPVCPECDRTLDQPCTYGPDEGGVNHKARLRELLDVYEQEGA